MQFSQVTAHVYCMYTLVKKLSITLSNARVDFRLKLSYILKMFHKTFLQIIRICTVKVYFGVRMTKIQQHMW